MSLKDLPAEMRPREKLLARGGVYEKLASRSAQMAEGLCERADAAGVPFTASSLGGLFGFFFHPGPVENFADASRADGESFKLFFAQMLARGCYLAPSPYECGFVSLAHRKRDIEASLTAAERAFAQLARAR